LSTTEGVKSFLESFQIAYKKDNSRYISAIFYFCLIEKVSDEMTINNQYETIIHAQQWVRYLWTIITSLQSFV